MEGIFKKSLCLAVLLSSAVIGANKVAPLISPRSRSVDSALELVGWTNQVNLYDMEGIYGSFAITPQYTRSFREDKTIIPCLFDGDVDCGCSCPTLKISGKCVGDDRNSTDWLADYFGLPTDFQSEVTFNPRVDTFSVDFNFYIGLNSWWEGLFFRIHAPVEHARYKLGFCETVKNAGEAGYDQGYFSEAFVPRGNLLNSFEAFVSNCQVPVLNGFEDDTETTAVTSSVVFDRLTCAKMSSCKRLTETKLSDIQMAIGWNFLQDKDYHLGIELRAAAPTGTRPEGCYLFEPIVGNGHHWELGGGVTGHILFWESDDEESHFGLWVDANVTHMFKTRQHRFFDLCSQGANSRYMLAMKLGTPVTNLFSDPAEASVANVSAPSAQFANVFRPVANLTCCDVDVSIGVQGDVTAMFNYTNGGFGWDLGYNYWGRSCEKIRVDCDCPCPLEKEPKSWALKGDAHVFGFVASDGGNLPAGLAVNDPVALSATNSNANIHAGSNVPVGTACTTGAGTATDTRRNLQVDNSQFALYTNGSGNDQLKFQRGVAIATANSQTKTSNNPVFLTIDDVDLCGARTRGQSHKIFTHLSYTWQDRDRWTPYIGIGAKAEFSSSKDCCSTSDSSCCDSSCSTSSSCSSGSCCSTGTCGSCSSCCSSDCDSCMKCNFSEWGVWVKGGVSFD